MALKGHKKEVYSASFSPDGTRIVTASKDGTARIWDAKTGQPIGRLKIEGHEDPVHAAAFSPDSARVITGLLTIRPVSGMLEQVRSWLNSKDMAM